MRKFAFYGRVSTEDQQDPTSSKQWQLARAEAILPKGARIAREYFDIGQSRSLPWKRRPEAAALLDDLKDPKRGFDAVVIGEPARAFYGSQFAMTFPVLTHHGVALWVPEIGGQVDPGSDAHDLVMSLYGGMSKGERNRIKIRVRSAMEAQAKHEGRFLGGRPPYGYQLVDVGPHPNPGKNARGQRLRRLEPDPVTARILRRIFDEYISGLGIGAIAEGLNRDAVPSPSGYDPARNRHRATGRGAWAKSAVRAILANPRYTGREVWNKQRHEEELLDVEDVAAGYTSRMRWNDKSEWIWSAEVTHEALVSEEQFEAAQRQRLLGEQRRVPLRSDAKRAYPLASLIYCAELHDDGTPCGRRMTGSFNHGQRFYRCTYPSQYAAAKGRHAKTVYVKEANVVPALDGWLLHSLNPKNLDAVVEAMAAAQAPDEAAAARIEAARRKLAECDRKLANLRKQVEGGNPPSIVLTWIREAETEKARAEAELAVPDESAPFSEAEIRALVALLRKNLRGLVSATPEEKQAIYTSLELQLTYHPSDDSLDIELPLSACTGLRVGGGT